jgi:hypothetical protein
VKVLAGQDADVKRQEQEKDAHAAG